MSSQVKHVPEEGSLPASSMVSSYRIARTIGVGGMGWVFEARHTVTGCVVALKVLREDQLTLERSVDRMMREAEVLASVAHAGIPRFYECGLLEDGRPWIAMELIEGEPLATRMQAGIVDPRDVIDVVAGAASVLHAAHARGVTHRDLKPDNIFLTPEDPATRVRIIDWGIAHQLDRGRLTDLNEAIGTPTYMSPEQARGGTTDGLCDVYGLGVVAYQALTGRPPFLGHTSVEILVQHLNRPVPALAPRCPDAPYGLVDLVERMLAKNPDERPSAEAVHRELVVLSSGVHRCAYEVDDTGAIPRHARTIVPTVVGRTHRAKA